MMSNTVKVAHQAMQWLCIVWCPLHVLSVSLFRSLLSHDTVHGNGPGYCDGASCTNCG